MYKIPKITVSIVRETTPYKQVAGISDSQSIYKTVLQDYFRGHDREEMLAVFLDAKHRVVGLHTVSIGSLTLAIVHPRETFKAAIIANCAAIILSHNHPSGDSTPSQEDIVLTKRLCEVGELVGIRVLDHIVVGEDNFYSFADHGALPNI